MMSPNNKENCPAEIAEKPLERTTTPILKLNYDSTIKYIRELMDEREAGWTREHELVFVWDMGELTALSNQHLLECATSPEKIDMASIVELMKRIEIASKVEDSSEDATSLGDSEYDSDASSDSAEEQFYNKMTDLIREDGPIIDYELLKHCGIADKVIELYVAAMKHQRLYGQRWLHCGKCLNIADRRCPPRFQKYENVVLSEEGTELGMAQLLISGLAKEIGLQNLYSTRDASKESIFEELQERFGQRCVLVYITSKNEKTAEIPETLKIPIWEVKSTESIMHLYTFMRRYL